MLPIETVVELLIENATPAKCGGGQVTLGGEVYDSLRVDELRAYIRTYLQTLIPPPKLLSECEDGKPYVVSDSAGWLDVVCRSGNEVTGYNTGRQVVALWGNASEFTAIQPVEVPHE